MWQPIVLLCVFLAGVKGQNSTAVSQCTNHPGDLPINTYVEGCLTPPCQLPQLQDVVLNIIFKAPRTMNSMRTLVTAYLGAGIFQVPIPYDLQENAITCNFLVNTYCPVLQNEVVQYTLRMFIESFFPVGTQVTLEFRVVDASNSPVICIRVPIRIVAAIDSGRLADTNVVDETPAVGDH